MSMFDALKNLGNIGDLMKKAREVQDQMRQFHEEMARQQITADAGGGMVQATVNGRLELLTLKIDPSRVDAGDTEMLEDLIVSAVRAAQGRAAEMLKEEMAKRAGAMGLPPGMLPQ